MEVRLDGRRALVTGANSGIGEAIAIALGEADAPVCVNYVAGPEASRRLVDRLRRAGTDALALQADISDPARVSQMFTAVDEEWGGLDILVNHAGIDGAHALGWEASSDGWRKVIDVNLMGTYLCAREGLRRMVVQKHGVVLL